MIELFVDSVELLKTNLSQTFSQPSKHLYSLLFRSLLSSQEDTVNDLYFWRIDDFSKYLNYLIPAIKVILAGFQRLRLQLSESWFVIGFYRRKERLLFAKIDEYLSNDFDRKIVDHNDLRLLFDVDIHVVVKISVPDKIETKFEEANQNLLKIPPEEFQELFLRNVQDGP